MINGKVFLRTRANEFNGAKLGGAGRLSVGLLSQMGIFSILCDFLILYSDHRPHFEKINANSSLYRAALILY